MKIITTQTGDMFVNCYIVFQPGVNTAVVIDPGGSEDKIFYQLEKNGLTVSHILLTHGHFDHIGAVRALKEKTGALVCIHQNDAPMLTDAAKNLSLFAYEPFVQIPADVLLKNGDHIAAGGMDIAVLHTPGHSTGSVCYLIEDALFTGDTLFYMSVGRTDFPECSAEDLDHSINGVLGKLQKDYDIYPGHGISSTLDQEKAKNLYFDRG